MRSNRPPAKIGSKSYSNQLLIDFFDPISAVRSIVATILIQIQIQISILNAIYIENWSKNEYYQPKWQVRPNF